MDDDTLWRAFAAHALTHTDWTHEAHLRVAWLHVTRYSIDEAHLRMRAGIIRLNERHGLVESAERGYFETLTRAWLVLVLAAQRETHADSSTALLAAAPDLLDRARPLRHYSRQLLETARARAIFVEPDLEPLPAV